MTPEPYDFSRPARRAGERDRRLEQWLAAAAKAAAGYWGRSLSFPAKLEIGRGDEVLPEEWLPCLPEATLGGRVLAGGGLSPSLLVLPRTLALALVDGVLGEPVTGLPQDRPLTLVEEALLEHATEVLLLRPLREAWPGPNPVALTTGGLEPNVRASRLLAAGEAVLTFPFRVTGPFGELDWCWLLPRGEWPGPILPPPPPGAAGAERERLEKLVREFPVDLAVRLGAAEVSLAQLTRLAPGDLVLLDQPTAEALTATVGGVAKFRVRPGLSGLRQAVQIESTLEG